MPEFILDRGSPESAKVFASLDEFTQGYIECMFFTEEDGELSGATFADLTPKSLAEIVETCNDFQLLALVQLRNACNHPRYNMERAGHDFWLTRNGHGAGFWDRGLGEVGEQLTKDAKSYSSCDPVRDGDGKVHVS